MLKQRVITALVLLVVVLLCLSVPWDWPFVVLVTVALGIAAWEWARLNAYNDVLARAAGVTFGFTVFVAWLNGWAGVNLPVLLWLLFVLGWLAAAVAMLRGGTAGWLAWPRELRLLAGLLVLAAVWLAVLQAFDQGVNYLLSLMALVWMADIGAYFAGRAFGQKLVPRKLAPTVSPGKSWEGVFGGMAGVLVLAALWAWLDQALAGAGGRSFYSMVAQQGWPVLVVVCVALAGMSVLGDLLESLVKRAAGAKDSSAILPGHGGILDRIDGLLPVMPAGMLVLAWMARTT